VVIDQTEMDALIAQAQESPAAQSAPPAAASPERAPKSQFVPKRRNASPPPPATVPAAELSRILKIRVPVIVRLARRLMPIGTIRNLSNGAILEFEKSVDDDLELLINNRVVGYGAAVKVDENFGLHIHSIGNAEQRIRSLGV
jgi:flagellar motor switch protein FliN